MDQLNLDQIKARIRRHLNKVKEDTAKNIAKTTGDDPHFVIQALNSMRTYTEVECEKKKGKGNEYWYWLTNASAESPESDTLGMSAAKVMGVTAVEVAGELRTKLETSQARIRELEARVEYLEPFERKHQNLDGLVADINKLLEGVEGIDSRNKIVNIRNQLKLAEQQRDDHFAELESSRATIDELRQRLEEKRADCVRETNRADENQRLFHAACSDLGLINEALGLDADDGGADPILSAIQELKDKADENADAVDVTAAAKAYLIRIPKKDPILRYKPEVARAVALSGARKHGRSDVFALVHIGSAVPGAEWKEKDAA